MFLSNATSHWNEHVCKQGACAQSELYSSKSESSFLGVYI
jgi:hypothetical protein